MLPAWNVTTQKAEVLGLHIFQLKRHYSLYMEYLSCHTTIVSSCHTTIVAHWYCVGSCQQAVYRMKNATSLWLSGPDWRPRPSYVSSHATAPMWHCILWWWGSSGGLFWEGMFIPWLWCCIVAPTALEHWIELGSEKVRRWWTHTSALALGAPPSPLLKGSRGEEVCRKGGWWARALNQCAVAH